MTTAKSKTKQWPPIHELTYSSGKHAWQVACQVRGERIRETFSTKDEAETRAAVIRTQVENEGRASFSLPASIRGEAVRGIEKLKPHNATITEAIDFYIEHALKYRTAPTVSEIIEKLLADAASNHRRERTIKDLRCRLTTFAKAYGERRIAEITREELKDWLRDTTKLCECSSRLL